MSRRIVDLDNPDKVLYVIEFNEREGYVIEFDTSDPINRPERIDEWTEIDWLGTVRRKRFGNFAWVEA